eukprot:11739683-Heterocapsa_arctica.AAC.1
MRKRSTKTTTAPPPAEPKGPPAPGVVVFVVCFRIAGHVLEIPWRVIAPLHLKSIDPTVGTWPSKYTTTYDT